MYKDSRTFNIEKVRDRKINEIYLPTKVTEALCLGIPVIFPNFLEFKKYSSVLIFFKKGDPESLAKKIMDCYTRKINYKKKGKTFSK